MAICVGCGLEVNAGVLEVQLRPNGGILCDNSGDADDGLFISIGSVSTSCIAVAGGGTTASPITISPIISPDACNGLQCRANGLYAHCPDSIIGSVNVGSTGAVFPVPMVAGGTYNVVSLCTPTDTSTCTAGTQIQVCNTLCCNVRGMWDAQMGGASITGSSADFVALASLSVSINAAPFIAASPPTTTRYQSFGVAGAAFNIANQEDVNFVELAPGACFSFSAQFTITVLTGSATWTDPPTFEFHWQLSQTGCC